MRYNLTLVMDPTWQTVLMCRRRKEPFRGRLNFVGGKLEAGETPQKAAERELWEETSLTKADVRLTLLMSLEYPMEDWQPDVFAGVRRTDAQPCGDENELCDVPLASDFGDAERFAGMGNLLHFVRYAQAHRAELDAAAREEVER